LFDVKVDGKAYSETLIDDCNFRTKNSFLRTIVSNDWDTFVKTYHKMNDYRKSCNYYLDGFVLKSLENVRLNNVDGNPKDCVAIKFPPQESVTTIKTLEINVGKTGEITPVLILEPVLLDGTTVKRASAHNMKYVITNGFYPGALIQISKSGDIIPQARAVIKKATEKYVWPTHCPECNSLLVITDIQLICKNDDCIAKSQKKLLGIKKFGIENLGESTLNKFYAAGLERVEDFFTDKFTEEYLINSGEFKKGRALEKIFIEFENLKEVQLKDVIYSLQFDNAGKSISREYAKKLAGIEYSFKSLDRGAIANVNEERVFNFIKLIETKGIVVKYPEVEIETTDTIKVEMTGTVNIEGVKTKADFINLFDNVKHVKLNKETDYLITNDTASTSGKMAKASKLGVKTITYTDFIAKFKK